jgi:dolichol-phosphate mannosyltransferase
MDIAVIIPTYNEKDNIIRLIGEIFALGIPGLEIVVVDDNSPDGTHFSVGEIMKANKQVHLIRRVGKLGYGTACISGFKYALDEGAENILGMDADFSHDPKMIPIFLRSIKKHHLVVGSRYKNGISIVNWPLKRLVLSLLAGKYVRFITGLKLTDPTSGFKCYRREVLEKINLDKIKSNGYSFLVEMKYRAKKKGFSIGEIPIIFVDRHAGTTKMSKAIIWEALIIVWKMRLGMIK